MVPFILTPPSIPDSVLTYGITLCLRFPLCQHLASVGGNCAWWLCGEEIGGEERKVRSVGRVKVMGAWSEAITAVLERSTHRTPTQSVTGDIVPVQSPGMDPQEPLI